MALVVVASAHVQSATADVALSDPVVTPASSYAINVPSSVLAAATAGLTAGGIDSQELAAMLANTARFNSDWLTTSVGTTMGGSTTAAPPDVSDLSPTELAEFDQLVAGFNGAPATKLTTFTKVAAGSAGDVIPVTAAAMIGVQLGAATDRAFGVDMDGGLCAGAPNWGFQAANDVLAALTSTDCDAWTMSHQLVAARNHDTVHTVTPTAIGSPRAWVHIVRRSHRLPESGPDRRTNTASFGTFRRHPRTTWFPLADFRHMAVPCGTAGRTTSRPH